MLLLATAVSAYAANNYKSFKVSVYTRAYEVEKMKDPRWLDSTWNIISKQLKVDKIWLETHRDLLIVPGETLEAAKKFFLSKGVEVGGGITYTVNERNNFETFCYSDPEHRKIVREIAEHTARHFDDFILDDFFFTSCKSDVEIAAKGDRSWTEYRTKLMTEAGKNLVLDPAKKVNPKVKVIIKYPNWYDHFQGLGFDLEHGPQLFDGVWSGTETRDPSGAQHLQNYLSYNIVTYLDNLRPGHNFGGWVDSGGSNMGMDRYAEQLWLTMFAKAPEIALFDYRQLIGVELRPEIHRTPWQGEGASFDYDAMTVSRAGAGVPATIAQAAGWTFEMIDPFVHKLGKPVGVKSYKPFHALGDDFLQNYMGMIGVPMDMLPVFPTDQKVVFLTEQAAGDPDIMDHIEAQLERGGDVVITTGLLEAIPEKIARVAELRAEKLALVNDFGQGQTTKDILIPLVMYQTNDSWEVVSAGRPLSGGVNGFPMLLRSQYSKGNLYTMTVPEDFGNLYDLPPSVLNAFRRALGRDLDVCIEGPSKVGLFVYDNGMFIVENFNDEAVDIRVVVRQNIASITDIASGAPFEKVEEPVSFYRRMDPDGPTNSFAVTLAPHSFRVFSTK